jgi:transcriptional antiterminator RfaH
MALRLRMRTVMVMATVMATGMVMATVMGNKTTTNSIWYVLYTKPKNEKKVYEKLTLQGFECYCPCQRTLKQWSDRKKWVEEPIFKSYIFVKKPTSQENRISILQSPGVVRFLYWLGKEAEVKQTEIEAIQKFLGEFESVEVLSFETGSILKIKDGALKGMDGEVDYQTEKEVVLKIEKLGMSLVAKVSKHHVEKKP